MSDVFKEEITSLE
jgi:hypothetical protein